MKSIVLASGNPGKKAEIEQLLAPFGTRVVTQVELGITEAEEPHDSFLENALAKARHVCFASRLPALAEMNQTRDRLGQDLLPWVPYCGRGDDTRGWLMPGRRGRRPS